MKPPRCGPFSGEGNWPRRSGRPRRGRRSADYRGTLAAGVVIAEIFLDLTGVGGIIQTESAYFRTANMLVGVLVFAVLGVAMMIGFDLLEKKFSDWKARGAD